MSHQEKDPGLLLHEKQRKPPVFLLPLPPPRTPPRPPCPVLPDRTSSVSNEPSSPLKCKFTAAAPPAFGLL